MRHAKLQVGKPAPFVDQSPESLWLLAKDKKLRAALLKRLQEHCPGSDGMVAHAHLSEQAANVAVGGQLRV